MKVVVDTNVVVSANFSDEGLPSAILDLAANRIIPMYVSPAVMAEYEVVLRRPISASVRPQSPVRWP